MELNTTEVSHSASLVGMEVFAEPESTICLRGRKIETPSEKDKRSMSEGTRETSNPNSFLPEIQVEMIKAFGPVTKTWFFQCGRARYATFIHNN